MFHFQVVKIPSIHFQVETHPLYAALPEPFKERIGRLRRNIDQMRSFYGYLLLCCQISRYCGVDGDTLKIGYGDHGKPFFINYPHIHFNLSHSGQLAGSAISDSVVGIDIERGKDLDINRISAYFSDQEQQHLLSVPDSERSFSFFRLWTQKESYIKAVGSGLSKDLNSFSILADDSCGYSVFEENCKRPEWDIRSFYLKNHHISFCSGRNAIRDFHSPEIIRYDSLEAFLLKQVC